MKKNKTNHLSLRRWVNPTLCAHALSLCFILHVSLVCQLPWRDDTYTEEVRWDRIGGFGRLLNSHKSNCLTFIYFLTRHPQNASGHLSFEFLAFFSYFRHHGDILALCSVSLAWQLVASLQICTSDISGSLHCPVDMIKTRELLWPLC